MGKVTLTLDEYEALKRIQSSERESEGARLAARSRSRPKRSRTPSAYSKRLGKALRRIRKKAIKKDGDFRKGWSNKKIMRLAHKEARRK